MLLSELLPILDAVPARSGRGWEGPCPLCDRPALLTVDDGTAEISLPCGCPRDEVAAEAGLDEVDLFALVADVPDPHGTPNPILDGSLSLADLRALPKPEPLISETLDLRTFAVLAGAPASRKSFLALDWSACVATGTPWQGRAAREGRVLYLAGEGGYGLAHRLDAWQESRGVEISNDALRVVDHAPQLCDDEDLEVLVDAVDRGGFSLVVVDTLARATVGVDENSAQDMGRVVAALDRVKRATRGGTVLAVHHTGKDGRAVRGSSALEGATDTLYRTFLRDGVTRLVRTKRKDGPTEDDHSLRAVEVLDSIVLDAVEEERPEDRERRVLTNAERAWVAWVQTFGAQPGTGAEFRRVLRQDYGIPDGSVSRAIATLRTMGVLDNLARKPEDPARFVANFEEAERSPLPVVEPFGLRPGTSLEDLGGDT